MEQMTEKEYDKKILELFGEEEFKRMKSTKYELKKAEGKIRYKDRAKIKQYCTLDLDQDPVLVKSFDNLGDAVEALRAYETKITELSDGICTYYDVTEYYVEENIYNDDDKWVDGGDINAFSLMQIELIEKPSYETIGTFDNYADAEKAYNDYDGEEEVYISL